MKIEISNISWEVDKEMKKVATKEGAFEFPSFAGGNEYFFRYTGNDIKLRDGFINIKNVEKHMKYDSIKLKERLERFLGFKHPRKLNSRVCLKPIEGSEKNSFHTGLCINLPPRPVKD